MNKILISAVSEVISSPSLEKKLAQGKPLRVKFGADPSAPNLHLGHLVQLEQLRRFAEAGHRVIFLIGNFTALIGDPSGRNKTRPALTSDEIKKNVATYLNQVKLVLDTSKVEIAYNSHWYKKMDLAKWLEVLGNFSANQILERDDFHQRLKKGHSLGMHELMYTAMQAYDSVQLKADVEIGGTDQRFNMLAGRELQKKMGLPPQDVVMMDILVGTDGKRKMSKSLGNTIDLVDTPVNIFGKVMSLPDAVINEYARLVLGKSWSELKKIADSDHPLELKKALAAQIVERLYPGESGLAHDHFEHVVRSKGEPKKMPVYRIEAGHHRQLKDILVHAGLVSSASQLERLVAQNGVSVDGKKISRNDLHKVVKGTLGVVKVGRRGFLKIIRT